jgi:branched-chain amino acid transport system permease protein/neutral amino acid transport system permease protein
MQKWHRHFWADDQNVNEILQLLIFGTVLGAIYALGATGVSLAFGILRFANFAHGAMMTVGAYFALMVVRDAGWPAPLPLPGPLMTWSLVDIPMMLLAALIAASIFGTVTAFSKIRVARPIPLIAIYFLSYIGLLGLRNTGWIIEASIEIGGIEVPLMMPGLVFAVIAMGGIAVTIDQVLYRRLRKTAPVILLISSFGVALILRSSAQIIWGSDSLVFNPKLSIAWQIGGLTIKPVHLLILTTAIIVVVALYLFLERTRLGKAMRAMADDPDLAGVTGIETERVIKLTWFISGGLAAIAGVFLALDTRLNPVIGFNALLPIFAAALVGGIGRPYGAIAGGMIVGMATELSTLFLPSVYKPAVAFVFVVFILIFRPTGIFRGR